MGKPGEEGSGAGRVVPRRPPACPVTEAWGRPGARGAVRGFEGLWGAAGGLPSGVPRSCSPGAPSEAVAGQEGWMEGWREGEREGRKEGGG